MTRSHRPSRPARLAFVASWLMFAACVSSTDDLELLVGRDWNAIRPSPCEGETALYDRELPESYALVSRRGRILFVHKEGGPIFEETFSESDREEQEERRASALRVLGVVDLGALDWAESVFSGGMFDEVSCRVEAASNPKQTEAGSTGGEAHARREIVLATVELANVRDEPFPAERAWQWSPREQRFEAVSGSSRVVCEFEPVHRETPDDFRAAWPRQARTRHRCTM